MQDIVRENQNHAEQERTRSMQDRIRENQNHAIQDKGEPEPCRTEIGRN
jgi:hypothetical protein